MLAGTFLSEIDELPALAFTGQALDPGLLLPRSMAMYTRANSRSGQASEGAGGPNPCGVQAMARWHLQRFHRDRVVGMAG